jgi:eukaryotic-like serine/threonine-protein kinase
VLYEMVTGRRAFDGKSRGSVIASILDRDPPPIARPERAAPGALDRLIRACLAKNPDDRIQSAQDVALALGWITDAPDSPSRSRHRAVPLIAAAAVLLLVALGAAALLLPRRGAPNRPMHLSLLPPPGYEFAEFAISRRGDIAFIGSKDGESHLFVREFGSSQPRRLTAGGGKPFWSPDGEWIAMWEGARKLVKVPVRGGSPETIAETSYGMGGTWRDDGTIVLTHAFFQPLHVLDPRSGAQRALTRLDEQRGEAMHGWPHVVPRGGGILYLSVTLPTERSRIFHVADDGGAPAEVIEADAIVGYSEPFLIFAKNGDVFAVRFDAKRRRTAGEPSRIAEKVAFHASDTYSRASVSPDGTLVYAPRRVVKRRLAWYDRSGERIETLLEEDDVTRPRLSPDGKRLLLTKFVHETGSNAIFRIDLERGTLTNITPHPRFGFNSIWIEGGEKIAFTSSSRTADYDLFTQLDEPQSQPVPLWEGRSDDKEALAAAPDGRHLIAREYTQTNQYDLWLVPIDGKGERTPLLNSPANETWGDISPDGRFLAYESNVSGTTLVYVRPTGGGRSVQVSAGESYMPRWSRDGTEILFIAPDRTLHAASFRAVEQQLVVGLPKPLFRFPPGSHYSWEFSVDGKRILVNEAADEQAAVARPLHVVSGWKQELLR